MTMALILAVAAPPRRGRQRADRSGTWGGWAPTWMLGRRIRASGSASSAWAASARRWRAAPAAFGLSIHYHNRRRVCRRDRSRAGSDLLGKPRPDAGPDGRRLDQLPAHAGDLSSAVGAAAEASAAACLCGQHGARRSDRRERPDAHAARRTNSPAPVSTSSSTSPPSIPKLLKLAKRQCHAAAAYGLGDDRRPHRHGRKSHHQHQDLYRRPQSARPRAAEHVIEMLRLAPDRRAYRTKPPARARAR